MLRPISGEAPMNPLITGDTPRILSLPAHLRQLSRKSSPLPAKIPKILSPHLYPLSANL
uniref:Uncharacterized protein n=1 Tax=Brassica oleracea var. oleracea TaxID=109376 RepID=A0A0D3D3I1_BRAOL